MKPIERAHEQLRRANPVPNPAALLAELTEATGTQIEGNQMDSVSTDIRKHTPKERSRGWVVGLTTALVILIIGAGSIFLTTVENPSGGGPSPVEVAQAYIDARNDYDAERALELISDEFSTNEAPDGYVDASSLEAAFQWHEIQAFEFTDVNCVQTDETTDGVSVVCDSEWSVVLHRAGGFPSETRQQLTFLIRDGEIIEIDQSGLGGPQWAAWIRFLESEHPDFLQVVADAIALEPEALRTQAEEMPDYLDLWQEWLEAQER